MTDLTAALKQHFGFDTFREGQGEAVRDVLSGQDVVLVMPTGSGKSLCYQLSAMLLPGVTVVVSPLIALMKDQVDGLVARGLPATCLNSSLSAAEMSARLAALRGHHYKLVYVAPERFRNRRFVEALRESQVSMVTVDEAHCISQWGHDFRPDYLRLQQVVAGFPEARVMALTATATPVVRKDIVAQLALGQEARQAPCVRVYGFSRPNLRLGVTRTGSHDQKMARVRDVVAQYPTGIVYCATRKMTERVGVRLKSAGIDCGVYHGGLPDEQRVKIQEQFMSAEHPVVVATNAFGMGVDRADLRFVIHWDIPGSLEAYYQEIGRAGRDGLPSWCELLFNYADVRTQEFFLDGGNPEPVDVLAVWDAVKSACADDQAVILTADDWAAEAGLKNGMLVRTCLSMIERAGLIERQRENSRTYTTRLVAGGDPAALTAHFDHLERKRELDRRKLRMMLDYVDTRACRHAFILGYFDDEDAADHCGNCDHCKPIQSGDRREPSEEEWVVVQKILSCAARMHGRFGIARVVQVLKGSKAAQIVERGLDQLSTYGLLSDMRDSDTRAIIEALIQEECLTVATGEYPVVSLTERGRSVALRKAELLIAWPKGRAGRTKAATRARDASQKAGGGERTTRHAALYEHLRDWRGRTAQGKPAYTVLPNSALDAISRDRPETIIELEAVPGIGPKKLQKYGNQLLAIVSEWREES